MDELVEAEVGASRVSVKTAIGLIAVAFSLFQIFTGAMGNFPALQQRSIHLGFALALVFLLKPTGRGKVAALLDAGMIALAVASLGYLAVEHLDLDARSGSYTALDLGVAVITTVLVLEGTRRTLGWALPSMALIFLIYPFVGPYLPGQFGHGGYSVSRVVAHTALFTEGIFGSALGVSTNFVFLFVLLAAFVNRSGAGQMITDAAFAAFGSMRGGPAKMAVVASSFFGMISGSAVANTGSIGPFTIPLMKRVGFEAQFAGAVESASGCGGQIMPPVMGAAAFVMADFLGIPYSQIALAGFVPAVLYYVTLFLVVHTHSVDLGIRGLSRSELPKIGQVFRRGWFYLIPPVVLVYMLGGENSTPSKAALWATVAVAIVGMFDAHRRIGPRAMVEAMRNAGVAAVEVALACACAGIIVGTFTLTGLGLKFSTLMIDLAQGNLLVLLVVTMIASLLLGAGLPSVPTYLLLAIIVAPAIIKLGVSPLASHMFIFYYGALADLTPPLAVSAYIAAGIAGADPFRTGITATRLAIAGFAVPYMFIHDPALLMKGEPAQIAYAVVVGLVTTVALAASVEGRMLRRLALPERLVVVVSAVFMVVPGLSLDLPGIGLLAAVAVWQCLRPDRSRVQVGPRQGAISEGLGETEG